MKLKIDITGTANDPAPVTFGSGEIEVDACLRMTSPDVDALLRQLEAFIIGHFGENAHMPRERELMAKLTGIQVRLKGANQRAEKEVEAVDKLRCEATKEKRVWQTRARRLRALYEELTQISSGRRPRGHAKDLKKATAGWSNEEGL